MSPAKPPKRPRSIDAEFFLNYAGTRRGYSQVYREHGYADECIELFRADDAPTLRKICVLGAATGAVLKDFDRAFGVKPVGCELSPWAHARIPAAYRSRVKLQDMREYVREARLAKRQFDLTFSNSLIYLPPRELPEFLRALAKITRYVHFRSSFAGDACADPYRRILKSYAWWNRQFERAGFEERLSLFGGTSYLWESKGKYE